MRVFAVDHATGTDDLRFTRVLEIERRHSEAWVRKYGQRGVNYKAVVDSTIKQEEGGRVVWTEVRAPSFQGLAAFVTSYVVCENGVVSLYRTIIMKAMTGANAKANALVKSSIGVATDSRTRAKK